MKQSYSLLLKYVYNIIQILFIKLNQVHLNLIFEYL